MAEELIESLKVERQELDPDMICDYNFFMGDLNYRFDCTYEELVDT